MSEPSGAEELNTEIAVREQRLTQVTADIRALLADDLPCFVEREAKRAFMARTNISGTLSDADVAQLKARATALGMETATAILKELEDPSAWETDGPVPEDRRSLAGCPGVWSRIALIEHGTLELLAEYGLAEDTPTPYKPPAFFINGRFLPALAEHFWRLSIELRELRQRREQVSEKSIRDRLETRWNDA